MIAVATLCWLALALRFQIHIAEALARGTGWLVAVVRFFSYFTILTNGLIALSLTLALTCAGTASARLLSRATVISGLVVAVVFTGIVYETALRHLWSPQGLHYLVDIVLHDLMPVLFLAYWVRHVPKQGLRWKHALLWLAYPLAYFLYILLHGALVGFYPYPFLNVPELGYPRVLVNAAMLLAVFLVLGFLLIAAGRVLPSPRGPVDRGPVDRSGPT